MEKTKEGAVTATIDPDLKLNPSPMLNLNSTYIEKAKGDLPKSGDVAPWTPRSNYLTDYCVAGYGNLSNGLKFSKLLKKVN